MDRLELRVSCPKVLELPDLSHESVNDGRELAQDFGVDLVTHGPDPTSGFISVTMRIFVSYRGQGSLSNTQIMLNLPDYVATPETSLNIEKIKGGTSTPLVIPVKLYVMPTMIPNSLSASAVAVYSTDKVPCYAPTLTHTHTHLHPSLFLCVSLSLFSLPCRL